MSGSYDFEEQERIAELKAWWEDNRWFVLGAFVAALAAFAGYRGYVYWKASAAEDAAAMYRPIDDAVKAKDAKKAPEAAQALIAKHPRSFYASDAALQLA
jgi:predicted negative regulator of RcsB-dependent stress response